MVRTGSPVQIRLVAPKKSYRVCDSSFFRILSNSSYPLSRRSLIARLRAQQVEHVLGKDGVTGSNPVSSSKYSGDPTRGSRFFVHICKQKRGRACTGARSVLQAQQIVGRNAEYPAQANDIVYVRLRSSLLPGCVAIGRYLQLCIHVFLRHRARFSYFFQSFIKTHR